jgi:hypothetical protein
MNAMRVYLIIWPKLIRRIKDRMDQYLAKQNMG